MDKLEETKNIIAAELGYWTRKREDEKDLDEKIKLHGACCEIMMYAGFPDKITADYLRGRYKIRKARADSPDLPDRALDLVARNRAVKACAAIIKLGKKINELEVAIDKMNK